MKKFKPDYTKEKKFGRMDGYQTKNQYKKISSFILGISNHKSKSTYNKNKANKHLGTDFKRKKYRTCRSKTEEYENK